MEQVVVACTSCGRCFLLPKRFIGRKAKCDSCFAVFAITNDTIVLKDASLLQQTVAAGTAPFDSHDLHDDLAQAEGKEADNFFVRCSSCNSALIAPSSLLGQSIPCPACQVAVLIQPPQSSGDTKVGIDTDTESGYDLEDAQNGSRGHEPSDADAAHRSTVDATNKSSGISTPDAIVQKHRGDGSSDSQAIEDKASSDDSSIVAIPHTATKEELELLDKLREMIAETPVAISQPTQSKSRVIHEIAVWSSIKVGLFSFWVGLSAAAIWLGWNLIMVDDIRWPAAALGLIVGVSVRIAAPPNDRKAMVYAGLSAFFACFIVDYLLAVRTVSAYYEQPPYSIMFDSNLLMSKAFANTTLAYNLLAVVCAVSATYPEN